MNINDIINKINELREDPPSVVVDNWVIFPVKKQLRGEIRKLIIRDINDDPSTNVKPQTFKLNKNGSVRAERKFESQETLDKKKASAQKRAYEAKLRKLNGQTTNTHTD